VLAIVGKLYDAFVGADAMLCEINPLIVTPAGEVKALDSKFTVDDNALLPPHRHRRDARPRGGRPAGAARA
jgi:succinyl-CoA synthetase beta subunit